jgi:hypothetical protein
MNTISSTCKPGQAEEALLAVKRKAPGVSTGLDRQ